jgi:phosphoglucosamine mutase
MKKLFGTDGMRGAAGQFPLDEKTIKVAGWSLARQIEAKTGKAAKFITGRDTRESGEWIERAFHAGAAAGGAECESAGVITTPGVAFLTQTENFDAGIVISASHNPFQDNGIKIFSPTGKKLDEATERRIEADIGAYTDEIGDSEFFHDNSAKELRDKYLQHLQKEFFDLSLLEMKIVVDCANGAAFDLAPELFESLGADVIALNDKPDGRNINLDCGSTHIENLRQIVVDNEAEIGVAFDGDADRALFVNAEGEVVDGDAVLWVMAQDLQNKKELKNNQVVATVMSNLGLEVALRSLGIELVRTNVGDKYVLQELLDSGSSVGGEQSGHIIFPHYSLVGDGMLTTLFLLRALRESGKTLAGMADGFARFPQILLNVKVKEKLPFDEVPEIKEAAGKLEKELGDTGRLLLRYSGTENLARVMIEGEDQETINKQAEELAGIIRKSLG